MPALVLDVNSDLDNLSALDVARKRVAMMELMQRQSQRKAMAALERRQATLDVQERTAQLILEHEEQKLEDFEIDPCLPENGFHNGQSPERERTSSCDNTVDGSTESVNQELLISGRISPVGHSDPETHHSNKLSPRRENKQLSTQSLNDKTVEPKQDQSQNPKRNAKKTDPIAIKRSDKGPARTKSRHGQIKREQSPRTVPLSRSPSPTKSSRSNSPTKSSRSSSPASSSSRKSSNYQSSGSVFSRLYPTNETKFDYLKKKDPLEYAEHEAHRERHRDSPHLIRRERSSAYHDALKLGDKRHPRDSIEKHVRTSSVPSDNLPNRTKQSLHPRSRSASPAVVESTKKPKKSSENRTQESSKDGHRGNVPPKGNVTSPHVRSHSEPSRKADKNKCQSNRNRAPVTTHENLRSTGPDRKTAVCPNKAPNKRTNEKSALSPCRSHLSPCKTTARSVSPKKRTETPDHRKIMQRPTLRNSNSKKRENSFSPPPRRKFVRSPVIKPKNWPSFENLPKSTPRSEAFYVPLTSRQLRKELKKHASEQDGGSTQKISDARGAEYKPSEQHRSPKTRKSLGKRSEETDSKPLLSLPNGSEAGFVDEEAEDSSSESYTDSLEGCPSTGTQQRNRRVPDHDLGPRIVDMTSADEDEFWAIPVSSEDIVSASSEDSEGSNEIEMEKELDEQKLNSDFSSSMDSEDLLKAEACPVTFGTEGQAEPGDSRDLQSDELTDELCSDSIMESSEQRPSMNSDSDSNSTNNGLKVDQDDAEMLPVVTADDPIDPSGCSTNDAKTADTCNQSNEKVASTEQLVHDEEAEDGGLVVKPPDVDPSFESSEKTEASPSNVSEPVTAATGHTPSDILDDKSLPSDLMNNGSDPDGIFPDVHDQDTAKEQEEDTTPEAHSPDKHDEDQNVCSGRENPEGTTESTPASEISSDCSKHDQAPDDKYAADHYDLDLCSGSSEVSSNDLPVSVAAAREHTPFDSCDKALSIDVLNNRNDPDGASPDVHGEDNVREKEVDMMLEETASLDKHDEEQKECSDGESLGGITESTSTPDIFSGICKTEDRNDMDQHAIEEQTPLNNHAEPTSTSSENNLLPEETKLLEENEHSHADQDLDVVGNEVSGPNHSIQDGCLGISEDKNAMDQDSIEEHTLIE